MIIVTGATGFIGSNIVAELNAQGRTDLLLVDDLGTDGKWKNIAKRRFLDIVDWREADALRTSLTGGVEAVFHMGADSSTTAIDGDAIVRMNLRDSMAWWRWCTEHGAALYYASSAATYGDGEHGFDDTQTPEALDRLAPLNLYGWTKHQFDKWAIERAAEGAAPTHWAGLKFFNVYGPNEYHKGDMRSLVAKNTALVRQSQTIHLFKSYKPPFADGQQLRDFVYVKDCVAVMRWMAEGRCPSGLYNLGTGQARSFVDLVNAIGAALSCEPSIAFVEMPERIRPNYQYFTQANMAKLKAAGCPHVFHSLEEGVRDYVTQHLIAADPWR